MPTFSVVAPTLPFGDAAAAKSPVSHRPVSEGAASILSIEDYRASEPVALAHSEADQFETLLHEATAVARGLGVEVQRRWLAGAGGGSYWRRGVLRVVLDRETSDRVQLSTVADALRGDHRLAEIEMSTGLADFLDIRRAA